MTPEEEYQLYLASLRSLPPEAPINDAGVRAGEALEIFQPPPEPPPGWIRERRVFGTGGRRALDLTLHRPADPTSPRPGVVLVHGGGFRGGFPEMHARHAHHLAERGYVSACINYRVVPEAMFPAALEDCKCALRWLRAHAAEIGLDPERLAVAGGSAGGNLAGMVALTPGLYEGAGGHADQPSDVACAVQIYPAVDLRDGSGLPEVLIAASIEYAGDLRAEASPIVQAHAGAPPILTITGDADSLTPVEPIRRFHERLEELGVANRLVEFPGRSHAFDYNFDDWQAVYELLAEFLDLHLAPIHA